MNFDVDAAIRPQDDLFRHVNGPWLAATEIPADKARYGAFDQMRDEAEAAVRDIITELAERPQEPGSEAAKIAALYRSFMDTDAIEARGVAGVLDAVDAIATGDDLVAWLASAARDGVSSLFGADVDADPGEPRRYRLFVGQGGLGLPDEEYYRLEQHAATRTAYEAHVGRMLALGGRDAAAAAAVLDLETRIAALHWDKVRCRDLRQMYNPMTVTDLGEPWASILASVAPDVTEVVNAQPSFFAEVPALLAEVPLETWRAWAAWHTLSSRSPYLTDALSEESFDFYGRTLRGTPQQRERWKRGVATVERFLGEAVGKIYVERHFGARAKERMDDLVAHLIEAYRRSITDLDWMTPDTKAEALTKLGNFVSKIGYPSQWLDYSALSIGDDLLANVVAGHRFAWADALDKVTGPVRDHEWFMTPQTVNAYYHPLRNEIVFPAAILRPPFFDVDADDAVNYGAIGAIIGHEIGHGFDDQGSTCDGEGRLRNWWTDADRAAFEERTAALVAQYDVLEPAETPGHRVNGRLTIGENIGDLGGLSIAHLAWQLARAEASGGPDGPDGPDADGHTPEQRLFLSWAHAWQTKQRPEAVKEQLATDPHSPAEFRCNQVVRNVPAFYAAFGLTEGDRLWLDPDDRVKIW